MISPVDLPANALLRRYVTGPGYADCYVTEVPLAVTHADYVLAFYTTPLFKTERLILKWLAARPSTDAQANALAMGSASQFAAWKVEARAENQILLADFTGRTRSWLMLERGVGSDDQPATRLYFGSAVVPRVNRKTGSSSMGFAFVALLGFHRIYSRLLLDAARLRLIRTVTTR